ncbi:hypothetical protein BH23ACT6_BH23ACT6_27640 [soil metagenome]
MSIRRLDSGAYQARIMIDGRQFSACCVGLRPRSLVRDGPAGWSPPPRCCVGTADASPAIGPAHTAVPDGHPPPPVSVGWPCAWRVGTRHGA